MLRFFRWLFGYVKFKFSGGFSEGFINECYEKGIALSQLEQRDGEIFAGCAYRLFDDIVLIANNNGGTAEILKKNGLIFFIKKFNFRFGLVVGAVLSIFIVNFLGGFVWNIDVVGNEKVSKQEILSFLNENGFHRGVYFKGVDKDMLQSLILSSFDDIGWVHINSNGTSATVEINEAVKKPDIYDKKGANLKANSDGVIVKAIVSNGVQKVKKGEAVVKGDLLASGFEQKGNKNFYHYAKGSFIAEVKEPLSITISRNQKYKAYYDIKEYKSLYFFGIKIPLYIFNNKSREYDEANKTNYILLNDRTIPIGIETKTIKSYIVYEKELDNEELLKLCNDEIEKYLDENYAKNEIIDKHIETTLGYSCAGINGYIICLKDIAEEVVFKY